MSRRKTEKQDTYRGWLTPWEKRVFKDADALPQHKYRVRRRLNNALTGSPLELTEILFSPEFYSDNVRNIAKWQNVLYALQKGYEHLLKPIEVKYDLIKVTRKGGRDYLYKDRQGTFRYKPGRVLDASPTQKKAWTEGLVIADRVDGLDDVNDVLAGEDNRKVLEIIDDPKKLRLWLSVRLIKERYPREIAQKALKNGYRFPEGVENAVPLSKVKWFIDKKGIPSTPFSD